MKVLIPFVRKEEVVVKTTPTTPIDEVVRGKLKEKGCTDFTEFAFKHYQYMTGITEVNRSLVISHVFGQLQFLDQRLTYIDVKEQEEFNSILTDMYLLLSIVEYTIPKEYRLLVFRSDVTEVVPNFFSALNCAWELSKTDIGSETSRLCWRLLIHQVRLLQRKIDTLSLETCSLDYENYLLDYLPIG